MDVPVVFELSIDDAFPYCARMVTSAGYKSAATLFALLVVVNLPNMVKISHLPSEILLHVQTYLCVSRNSTCGCGLGYEWTSLFPLVKDFNLNFAKIRRVLFNLRASEMGKLDVPVVFQLSIFGDAPTHYEHIVGCDFRLRDFGAQDTSD